MATPGWTSTRWMAGSRCARVAATWRSCARTRRSWSRQARTPSRCASRPAPGYQGRPYPRFDPAGGDPDRLVSNAWLMRMDRASHPAVFAQTQRACLALAGPPAWDDQLGSVGFGLQDGDAWLALRWPWEE